MRYHTTADLDEALCAATAKEVRAVFMVLYQSGSGIRDTPLVQEIADWLLEIAADKDDND